MLNVLDMNTPKSPTVALDCLGCKLNQAEIQQLARQLEAAGYVIVAPDAKADVYILNTCSVTLTADSKSRHLLRMARRRNPAVRLVAIGCYAQRDPKVLEGIEGVELVLGNDNKMDLVALLGEVPRFPPKTPPGREEKPRETGRTRSFLKIQEGCRNFCTYCIVPYVRAKESSVSADKVISLVKKLETGGCREIVLTGTEIGAYQSKSAALEALIQNILEATTVPRIRISSLQPHHITPGLIKLWQDPRLCPHFHLSLQSGSDTVLKRMNRKYTAENYRQAVALIRQTLPEAAITTDVIVGFPGETEAEFRQTLEVCRAIKFARIHVFPFSPRPGTAAALMTGQIPDVMKKERTAAMLTLANESARYFREGFVGKTLEVLWEQAAGGVWSGYTGNYIKIYTKTTADLTNKVTPAKLLKLYRDGVWGEVK
jgi:threonylcarbamoyladenosine tRNA methylthiotransferase MtaB